MQHHMHIPVLLKEAVASLRIRPQGCYVDGTFGAGGYTQAILEAYPDVRVFAIDRDITAIEAGQDLVQRYSPRLTLIHGCFGNMDKLITQKVDGVVLDIGVSSMQIDQPERGFSFQKQGPLDMRMGLARQTAADVVNTYSERELADIIFTYGEERFSRQIAKKIVLQRQLKPFETTFDLVQVIHQILPSHTGIDSATRTFQALRIYVNDELGELERGLQNALKILKIGGVLSVVSFHSLEDRIVKKFFVENTNPVKHYNKYKAPTISLSPLSLMFKKPISPTDEEVKGNSRSRSAHLRSAIFNGECV